MMQLKLRKILIITTLLSFFACEKADKDIKWGLAKLYMPQSVAANGGINNNYVVKIDKQRLSDTTIVVGLYRSGLEDLKSVRVDLEVYPDTLVSAIAQANLPFPKSVFELYKTAKLLPISYYELPPSITLQDGIRETTVRLIVKRQTLSDDSFFISGNRYVLPVRITNPTRYVLNPALSLTMFMFEVK